MVINQNPSLRRKKKKNNTQNTTLEKSNRDYQAITSCSCLWVKNVLIKTKIYCRTADEKSKIKKKTHTPERFYTNHENLRLKTL